MLHQYTVFPIHVCTGGGVGEDGRGGREERKGDEGEWKREKERYIEREKMKNKVPCLPPLRLTQGIPSLQTNTWEGKRRGRVWKGDKGKREGERGDMKEGIDEMCGDA